MGIVTRVRDIVNSNINAALDKAEDPEKLVRQMIREMEDTLIEIKAACAGAMAARRRADRDFKRADRGRGRWTSRAERAVDRGRDDLARDALRARRRHEEESEIITRELEKLEDIVEDYKKDIVQIEDKLASAREKERIFIQRHIHAIRRTRAQREIRRFDTSKAFVRFDTFEGRIDIAEAHADLANYGRREVPPLPKTLEQKFEDMERDEQIEQELEKLKQNRTEDRLVHA